MVLLARGMFGRTSVMIHSGTLTGIPVGTRAGILCGVPRRISGGIYTKVIDGFPVGILN